MPVHYLTEPIDIFYEWLDACEREEKKRREGTVDLLGSALGQRLQEKKKEDPKKGVALGEEDSDTDEEERLLSEGQGLQPARSSETNRETSKEGSNGEKESTTEKSTEEAPKPQETVGEKRTMASLGFDDSDDSD